MMSFLFSLAGLLSLGIAMALMVGHIKDIDRGCASRLGTLRAEVANLRAALDALVAECEKERELTRQRLENHAEYIESTNAKVDKLSDDVAAIRFSAGADLDRHHRAIKGIIDALAPVVEGDGQ